MGGILTQRGRLSRVVVTLMCLGAVLAGLLWGFGGQSGSAASPVLVLDAPEEALVGEPIELRLVIDRANGIAAFDVTIGYDTSIAELQSLRSRENDLAKLGRDVEPLGPVELPNGVAVGAYSCPVDSCADPDGKRKVKQAGASKIRLATVTIVANQPGPLTLDLSSARFADAEGRPVEVDLAGAVVIVQVMPNGQGE